MILDRLLCQIIAVLAASTVLSAIFLTLTVVPVMLALATVAAAALLWLVRKTVRASVEAARR